MGYLKLFSGSRASWHLCPAAMWEQTSRQKVHVCERVGVNVGERQEEGNDAGCSPTTASNYIRGVKSSITPPISLSVTAAVNGEWAPVAVAHATWQDHVSCQTKYMPEAINPCRSQSSILTIWQMTSTNISSLVLHSHNKPAHPLQMARFRERLSRLVPARDATGCLR